MEAALAFSSGGSLPCYEVAVSPAALAEAAILPLVDLLASECTDAQREAATQALHSLTSKVANIFDPRETPLGDLLVRTGGVSPLVALLREGSVAQKEYAAGTLHNLANTSAHRTAIADAGAIVPLVLLARDGTDTQKEHSALALGDLAFQHATTTVSPSPRRAAPRCSRPWRRMARQCSNRSRTLHCTTCRINLRARRRSCAHRSAPTPVMIHDAHMHLVLLAARCSCRCIAVLTVRIVSSG